MIRVGLKIFWFVNSVIWLNVFGWLGCICEWGNGGFVVLFLRLCVVVVDYLVGILLVNWDFIVIV